MPTWGSAARGSTPGGPTAVCGGDDHPRTRDVLLASIPVRDDRFETNAILRRHRDDNACSHSRSLELGPCCPFRESSEWGNPLATLCSLAAHHAHNR
jgi:hypothetical protein